MTPHRFAMPPQVAMRLRDLARMHMMFGGDLLRAQRSDEAEAYLRAALAVDPELTTALGLLSRVLLDTLRADEAVAALRAAVAREPDNLYHRGALGSALLLSGRYAEGWPEWIATRALSPPLGEPAREWTGQPLRGCTLLVVCCDGFGDAFQFSRYVPNLAAAGATVILACQPAAIPVLRRVAGVAQVIDRTAKTRPPHDFWTEDKLLPLRFSTTLDSIPLPDGHLSADPMRRAHWGAKLEQLQPRRGRMRVGLVWGGDPRNDQDPARSLPQGQVAALLAPLLALPLAFVSLQHGARAVETASLVARQADLIDLAPSLADFGETAAVLANLDLLIGVETGTTHLGCAMGLPCWLMLSRRPDWRWLLAGDTSPWYETARLWRQPQLGNWPAVIEAMTEALRDVSPEALPLDAVTR